MSQADWALAAAWRPDRAQFRHRPVPLADDHRLAIGHLTEIACKMTLYFVDVYAAHSHIIGQEHVLFKVYLTN